MKALFFLLLLVISLLPITVLAEEAPGKSTPPSGSPLVAGSTITPTAKNGVSVKSPVPSSKPSPLAEALLPPPSKQLLPVPSPQSFQELYSRAGNYGLKLPKAFGSSPLAELTPLDDLAMVHAQGNKLFAINLIDHSDTLHYRPTQPLPDFSEARVVLKWQQPTTSGHSWDCRLLHQQDFNGSFKILKASAKVSGLTYEVMYLLPSKDFMKDLPELLYSLHSFKS